MPRSSSPKLRPAESERKERILTQPHPTHVSRTTDAVVCKYGSLFFTSNDEGDVPIEEVEHGLGLYLDDCRYLDGYALEIDGLPPSFLASSSAQGFETLHHLSNPQTAGGRGRSALPKDALAIRRHRVVRDQVLYEVVTLHNYGAGDLSFRLHLGFRSRFRDVFAIKGFVSDHGTLRRPAMREGDTVVLRYDGLDRKRRTTTITFSPKPDRLSQRQARFDVAMKAGEERRIAITITPREQPRSAKRHDESATQPHFRPDDLGAVLESDQREWLAGFASVRSSDELLDRVMERALRDLRILRSRRKDLHFIAAGVPWFATLFGRDSCVVGLQTLPFGSRLAGETLKLLARFQATAVDAYRDAEPGKMLHELRTGELADAGRIPQSPAYYGTIDATLLWMILLVQYVNWTGDLGLLRELRANLEAAVEWSVRWADHDGDGYLDYVGAYKNGLVNQGWKDSGNAIVNEDGTLAVPPIALCEVQAYAYRAWRGAARCFEALGDKDRCDDLMRRSEEMRARFERDFWSDRLGAYLLALQRDGRPCEVVSSNAGQVLWGGIAGQQHAARVVRRLMEPDMFSGWGIRTLSSAARAYNPLSYHLGSVWPHDNALIVGGLRRYGFDGEAERVFSALYEAAAGFRDQRVPELYCGYPRDGAEEAPVDYPVACRPQAWAAGALPYALWQILGLRARTLEGKLLIDRPRLPRRIQWLEIHGLSLGDAEGDVRFERQADGSVDVRTIGDAGLRIERSA